MLKVVGAGSRSCDRITRRSFLQAGVLGVGGLALGDFLGLRSARAAAPQGKSGTSVILFWLSGGPGHMETWDPKPDAPDVYRGPLGSIPTKLPGVRFGELLPRQASLLDQLAVVRTVNHGSGDHTKSNHWMLTGFEGPAFNAPDFMKQRRPALGSAVARLRGPNRPGMPPYVAVPHLRGGTDNFFHYAAYLGGGANPFITESDPNSPQFRVRYLSLPAEVPFDRLEDRRHVLESLDRVRRAAERPVTDMADHYQRAFELLTGKEVVAAFDMNAEPLPVRDNYGRHTFGQSALLARRLIEAGATFVTVNCVPWDHHGTPPQMKTEEGARLLLPHLDRAVGALIEDLIQRGLYEKTLVVVMGEFGRTPRMNANSGRDHWGNTFSVLFGSGSMKMGQVIGKSSSRGEHVVDRPVSPQDVAATVYHHLGIDASAVTFTDGQARPTALIETGKPIRELI
jgi:uncharacterized protein (DUF1501 family)